MAVTLFFCPQCAACRHLATAPVDERVRCVACDTFFPHAGCLFGPGDWKSATDPTRMTAALAELNQAPGERKWRLLSCAIARAEFDWCRNPWFLDALAQAERWADDGERPRGAAQCAAHFAQITDWEYGRGGRVGWISLARRMVRDNPRPRADDAPQWRTLSVSLLRELCPDPFHPIAWNPEWLTSTVRTLAARIYEAQEFGAMPILADALQDAECDDKRVLRHCREGKQHVRGCWVLDAILGRP